MRIGVNLLICNAITRPQHLMASQWAVESLLTSDLDRHDWRLLVIDNGSDCPKTQEWLQALPGRDTRIGIMRIPENVGIARGRNVGYRELLADGQLEFVIEIHNDHVFPRDWLAPLIDTFEREPHAGIVCPGLITGGGQWRSAAIRALYSLKYEQARARIEAFVRARRRAQTRIGLQHPAVKRVAMMRELALAGTDGRAMYYDEGFPGRTNFEDIEEAYRAYKAGWQVVVNLASCVFHYYHFSRLELTNCDADFAANRLYMDQKHGAGWTDWHNQIFAPAMGALYP